MAATLCPRCGEPQSLQSGLVQHQRGKECLLVWLTRHGMSKIVEWNQGQTFSLETASIESFEMVWRDRQRVIWAVMATKLDDAEQLAVLRALFLDENASVHMRAFQTFESVGRVGPWAAHTTRLRAFLLGLVAQGEA